jgi:hypothetical protein
MVLTHMYFPNMRRQDAVQVHHLSDTAEILLELSRSSSQASLHNPVLSNNDDGVLLSRLDSSVTTAPQIITEIPSFLLQFSCQDELKTPAMPMALSRPNLGSFHAQHLQQCISSNTSAPACLSYDHSRRSLAWHVGATHFPLDTKCRNPRMEMFEKLLKHQLCGLSQPSGWIRTVGGEVCLMVDDQQNTDPRGNSLLESRPDVVTVQDTINCKREVESTSQMTSRNMCKVENCTNSPAYLRAQFCTKHVGYRRCSFENCDKTAQGKTKFCIMHGGGRRCTFPGCEKGARDKLFCAA